MGKPCTAKTTGYHGCILAGERGGGYENVADKATINTCNLNISRSVLIRAFSTCTNYPSIVLIMHLKFVSRYNMSLVFAVWTAIIAVCLQSATQHECRHYSLVPRSLPDFISTPDFISRLRGCRDKI